MAKSLALSTQNPYSKFVKKTEIPALKLPNYLYSKNNKISNKQAQKKEKKQLYLN